VSCTAIASIGIAACSGGSSTTATTITTIFAGGTAPGGGTFGPTTTFMPTCTEMPSVTAIASASGLAIAAGVVSGSGTCQYLGLNDQTKSIGLSKFTTDADKASFTDLQSSLGAATPVTDPALPNAFVGANHVVFATVNGVIYVVKSYITDGGAADVPASEAVLKVWLAG
jgi:hypothetical protein